ncbi:hypothetical protein Dvina_15375 [Dactylosporangium vinaceum]|uniref:Uncharacterized protein n=1 Tax=Dactylosporangium vinaceum TaxID=53362 RepID=A0ABV5M218_9ACTN|nr:hypothetical protein [Dactylosporangium vinaceum]UAB99333.1 hypothetical protein Dvina_15375 [Dactylosporangium vinaceum]
MSDPLETLVRDAQRARAGAGRPDLERIRRALPVLVRRRARRRRAGVVVAAAVLVLAGAGGVRALPGGTPGVQAPGPERSPSASTSTSTPLVAMPYELADPPGAYRESLRTIDEEPDGVRASRVYSDGPRRLVLGVRPGLLPGGEVVQVGPNPAVYRVLGPDHAEVAWVARLGGVVELEAVGTGLDRDGLVAVAGRVADHSLWLEKPITLGWTPRHPIIRYSTILGDNPPQLSTVTATGDDGTLSVTETIYQGPIAGAEIVSLHAQPASLVEDGQRQSISQRMPYTDILVTITLEPPQERRQFLAIAETVTT